MHRTPSAALAALALLMAGPPGAEAAPLLPGDTLSPVPPLAPPQGSVAGHVDATFHSTSGPFFTGMLGSLLDRSASVGMRSSGPLTSVRRLNSVARAMWERVERTASQEQVPRRTVPRSACGRRRGPCGWPSDHT
jgi:hypothetical protein